MSNNAVFMVEAEINELKRILDSMPKEALIERYAFEQRLSKAIAEYEAIQVPGKAPEKLRLTFRGSPVSGSKGIFADFAGKASQAFSDAFSAILAGLNSSLQYMGPIPDKSKYPLLITGTAVGSFGFEVELPVEKDLFASYSKSDEAIEKFRDLLRVSALGSDDEIADIVQDIHPRAVRKVADFLQVLHQSNAWCGLEFRNKYFKYANIDELGYSESRLREDNIDERQEEYFGEFQGVLPQSRNFEFRLVDDGAIIKGKIDREIEDPDRLNREWLHTPLRVKFHVVQVGQGRPRYSFLSFEDLDVS